MPVSTFSHDSTTVRAGARSRSEIVSRWNSTRERILLDEQRVKKQEIIEMDGTGLHEKEDWPMRPVSDPPEGARKFLDAEIGKVGNHHIIDVATGSEPEAQWVADEDVGNEEQQLTREVVADNGTTRGRPVLLPVREEEETAREPFGVLRGHDSGTSVSPPDAAKWVDTTTSERRISYEPTQHAEPVRVSIDDPNASLPARRDFQPFIEDSTVATATPQEQSGVSPIERTLGTPEFSRRTSPVFDGSHETSTFQVRQSSTAKSTPPDSSSQRSSTYNPYNTAQVSQNPDRVRYSWQSSQDEEPNRPRIITIRLVSETVSSSAGFPQGEAFGFSISPGGQRIAAYNSARLYILQTTPLPVGVSQDFALKRRPLAVEITDSGTLLAILPDRHTVNIYDLSHRLRRSRTIKLDFPTYCIALAPTGGLLAAAYDGGVEIFSLDPKALPTDRRAVRSQKMDRLSFSMDGSTLLGTTTRINASSSVVVNVPVFPASPDGVPTSEELKEAWCSELLHPENIRNSSHATFMRENSSTCSDRLFAWNGVTDTFGILNTTDLQYGRADFPVVISPPLSTCGGLGAAIHSCPAIDEHGDTVAMIVNDRTVRLYIVPHKAAEDEVAVEAHSIDHELDEGYGCPFSDARWVYSEASIPGHPFNSAHVQGRLLVTSPGGVGDPDLPEESVPNVEGGRIILFDFDSKFAGQRGETYSLTLGKSPPQMLEEPIIDVADEVALVRRRTVNQSKGGGLSQRPVTLGRAATTFNPARNGLRSASPALMRRANSSASAYSGNMDAAHSLPDLMENEVGESGTAIDEPFLNTAPRSQASLQTANSNVQRHKYQTLEERVHECMSGESSASFLPLPEYSEEPNTPLPGRYRALAGLDTPARSAPRPAVVTKSNGGSNGTFAGPATAPAFAAENFTPEQVFAAAIAASPNAHVANGGPVQRPMPRSLQRAYSNATAGPPPRLIEDWMNVSPVLPNGQHAFPSTATAPDAAPRVSNEEMWNSISPDTPRNNQYRYSTSRLNPPGHQSRLSSDSSSAVHPARAATTLPPQQFPNFATNRRLPPHIQAFRDAAAASGSSALFSGTQPTDHVPHRLLEPTSTIPHPVTAWHPPAPSSPAPAPSVPRGNGAMVRSSTSGHSRRASQLSVAAFPTTAKAKRMGFFKRKKQPSEDFGTYGHRKDVPSRNVVNWMSGKKKRNKEGGCLVM